jgi:hypothetical protein
MISATCPYLIERAMVAIMRAVIHLMHYDSATAPVYIRTSSERSESSEVSNSIDNSKSIITDKRESCLWDSMRLLRGIPPDVICHIADRLGAGLLAFVK